MDGTNNEESPASFPRPTPASIPGWRRLPTRLQLHVPPQKAASMGSLSSRLAARGSLAAQLEASHGRVTLCSSLPKLMWWRSSPAVRTKLTLFPRESAGICSWMNRLVLGPLLRGKPRQRRGMGQATLVVFKSDRAESNYDWLVVSRTVGQLHCRNQAICRRPGNLPSAKLLGPQQIPVFPTANKRRMPNKMHTKNCSKTHGK
jgi:hypothetical protein